MEYSIVHAAIARKMLCDPLNNLIADTEFACAAGMLLRILKAGEEACRKAQKLGTIREVKDWLFEQYAEELSGEFDIRIRRLIDMVKSYQAEEVPMEERLRELLAFGCWEEIHYPAGRFL